MIDYCETEKVYACQEYLWSTSLGDSLSGYRHQLYLNDRLLLTDCDVLKECDCLLEIAWLDSTVWLIVLNAGISKYGKAPNYDGCFSHILMIMIIEVMVVKWVVTAQQCEVQMLLDRTLISKHCEN